MTKLPKRYKNVVGKYIGGKVYVHRYCAIMANGIAEDELQAAENLVRRVDPKFIEQYNLVAKTINKTEYALTFSPDFDTADEPTKGLSYLVNIETTEVKKIEPPADPWIYHHKWLWVFDSYTGFDVEAAKARSRRWMFFIANTDNPRRYYYRIGKKSWWETNVVPFIRKGVIGYYHEHGYNIWETDEQGNLKEEIYTAGNNPAESTSMVNIEDGVSLETLRDYCEKTGKEFAQERNLPWNGAHREEDPYNYIRF